MNFFEQNLKYITGKKTFLLGCLTEEDETEVVHTESLSGESVVQIKRDGYTYSLNSMYNTEDGVERWMKQFEEVHPLAIFVIMGLANGRYLEVLHDRYPQNMIILYEPSVNVLKAWLEQKDNREYLESEYIYIAAGERGKTLLQRYYNIHISYKDRNLVSWYVLPGYLFMWTETIQTLRSEFNDMIEQIVSSKNTVLFFGKERVRSILHNINDMRDQYSLGDLYSVLSREDIRNRPAIIVAAGPSLDKNIDELGNAKGKAFIIAVDTAIKSLEKHGIIPDIVVSVDSKKPLGLFEAKMMEYVPLVLETASNSRLTELHGGRRFYSGTSEVYSRSLLQKLDKKIEYMLTGGSVANSAFSIATKVGFSTIMLVGQDLAYPDNRQHTAGAYDDAGQDKLSDKKKYFEVEDIYGNMVLTEGNMDMYRRWLEKEIRAQSQITVIDATEGGAKINGTQIMTLREALCQYCADLEPIDFNAVIDGVPPYFNEEERIEFDRIRKNLPDKLNRYRKKLELGITDYENMERLIRQGRQNSKEFKKSYANVSAINNWMEGLDDRELLDLYKDDETYSLVDEIVDIKTDEEEELEEVIRLGKAYYDRYINAINSFMEDAPILLGEHG